MLLCEVRHSILTILSSMNLIKNDRRQTGISSIELIICTLVDQEAKITLIMMKSKCNRTDMSLK